MKLITKEIEKKLQKAPLYSKDGQGESAEVVVKFFNPYGIGTWLVTEGEKQPDGDWMFFGKVHLFEWEWGYFTLSELEQIRPLRGFPLGIERDMYSKGTVEQLMH